VTFRVASVTVDQGDLTLVPGGTLQLSATPHDPAGNRLGIRATGWSSSDPLVIRVSLTGSIEAVTEGVATLTATVEGVNGSSTVRVERLAFVSVSASELHHTCGRTSDGRVACWGLNNVGQLGLAAVGRSTSAVAPVAAPRFAEVSSGATFTCGRTSAGQVYCWGSAARGRLGTGSLASTPHAGLVPLTRPLLTLSSGWNHTCGVSTDDRGYCWGEFPQVGNYPSPVARTPVSVLGEVSYEAIAAGEGFTCGIATDSLAYCWGTNLSYRLGVESLQQSVEPVPVNGGLRFTTITIGGLHTCGLTATGDAHCWGGNAFGELGASTGAIDASAHPQPVAGGLVFSAIAVGAHTSCALTPAGAAYCWGENDAGQLGAPTTELCNGTPCSRTPLAVSGGLQFAALSVGDQHSCGVTVGAIVYCWGKNDAGQLGDGTLTDRAAPTRVAGQR
jgi:alpha-tubulin suppressor-like RCC1 family protein